jgi:hypothetical protein
MFKVDILLGNPIACNSMTLFGLAAHYPVSRRWPAKRGIIVFAVYECQAGSGAVSGQCLQFAKLSGTRKLMPARIFACVS